MYPVRASLIVLGLSSAAAMLPLDLAKADQVGHASWYALHSQTASGEQMNPSAMTAAHRSLPFGTTVLVENLSNGKSVVVRINDRGPFIAGRIIDVSKAAASTLGMLGAGTAKVRVKVAGGASVSASPVKKVADKTASKAPVAKKVAAKPPAKSGRSFTGGGLLRAAPKVTQVAARERARQKVAAGSDRFSPTATRQGRNASVFLASASRPYGGMLGRTPGFME